MCFNPTLNRSLNFFEWCPFEDFVVSSGNDVGFKTLNAVDGNDLREREKPFSDNFWRFGLDSSKRFFNEW